MKALVLYDSRYGNTQKVAETVANAIGNGTRSKHVDDADVKDLAALDLLVVGSPTHGGRPSEKTQAFLSSLSGNSLDGVSVAAFDTRISEDQGFFLRIFMKMIQYAAPRIQKKLDKSGGSRAGNPEGFIVEGREGPLADKELERAAKWAKALCA